MNCSRFILAIFLLLAAGISPQIGIAMGGGEYEVSAQSNSNQSKSGNCVDCGAGDAMTSAMSCSAMASCAMCLVPDETFLTRQSETDLYDRVDVRHSGIFGLPEPFPPKIYILV